MLLHPVEAAHTTGKRHAGREGRYGSEPLADAARSTFESLESRLLLTGYAPLQLLTELRAPDPTGAGIGYNSATDVDEAPAVTTLAAAQSPGTTRTLDAAFFSGGFADPDAGDTLQRIRIISLPGHGMLTLGSSAVVAGQEIGAGQLGSFSYTPDAGYIGLDNVLWNACDGQLWAASPASLQLTVGPVDNVISLSTGSYAVAFDLGATWSGVALSIDNTASVVFQATQHLSDLALSGSAQAALATGGFKLLRTSGLAINGTASLDLSDNGIVVDAGGATAAGAFLSYIAGKIGSARNTTPLWSGHGVTSGIARANPFGTMGIGAIVNADASGNPIASTIGDEALGADSVLVKYACNGDTDLDGRIDADDYFHIDRGFLNGGSTYAEGDFSQDGAIDAEDYFLIDLAFLRQGQTAIVDVRTTVLRANTPGQAVPLLVSGGVPVTGFNLRAQIGDGGNPSPKFQAVSFAGGIWDASASTATGELVAGFEQYAQFSIAFNNNTMVPASGVLAILIIDTTGIATDSTYALRLSGVELIGQDSDFILSGGAELVPVINNGTLHIVP